jgi:hypothetical protein
MTYEESAALMTDVAFRGRIKVACLQYSTYIMGEPANVTAHSTRIKWAQQTANSPDQTAASVQPMVVMDANVQTAGAAITDAALQTAVEATVNKII